MAPTKPFSTVSPDIGSFQPPKTPSNFSSFNADIDESAMYIHVTAKRPLIKGEYGDGKTQESLRESFNPEADKLLMYGTLISPSQMVEFEKWEDTWRKSASAHLAATTAKKRGTSLQYLPLLKTDDGTGSFKFNVPVSVLEHCRDEAGVGCIFDLEHAHYDVVFRVSGMWRNNSNYGLSLSALRLRRGKPVTGGIKRKMPDEFEFGENTWAGDASDEE